MRTFALLSVAIGVGVDIPAAWGQSSPQFSSVKKPSDSPVVIQWASDPLTVYKIETSSTLAPAAWEVAQENFPSQGSTTYWTDSGRESSVSPRLSSAQPDAPIRFYRLVVERQMANTSPVNVTIDNFSEGATISEHVDVLATASAPQGIGSTKLYVDGDEVNTEIGTSVALPLESRYYPNGTHRLSVVAMDAGGLESTEQEVPASTQLATYGSKNINVTFNNFLSNVQFRHKAFRPDLGQVQRISATWSSPRLWRVDITTADSLVNVFRSFTGEGSKIVITWDGTDSIGVRSIHKLLGIVFMTWDLELSPRHHLAVEAAVHRLHRPARVRRLRQSRLLPSKP